MDENLEYVFNDVFVELGGVGYIGYFYNYYGNGFNCDNIEVVIYDVIYVKFCEVSFFYCILLGVLELVGIVNVSILFVGCNLLFFINVLFIDLEIYFIWNGLFVNGFESMQLLFVRSFGFFFNLGF